jgi:hypothetical protein
MLSNSDSLHSQILTDSFFSQTQTEAYALKFWDRLFSQTQTAYALKFWLGPYSKILTDSLRSQTQTEAYALKI